MYMRALILCGLAALAAASPLNRPTSKLATEHQHVTRDRDIEGIREAYRGIHWDDALAQCTEDQFNILVESSRMALDVTSYNLNQYYTSSAWNRYFVKDSLARPDYGWHGGQLSQDTFWNIRNNIQQVSQFPRKGKKDRNGNWSRGKQTSYRCQEIPAYNKCAKAPLANGKWTGPSAYTAQPSANPDGWAVVFCPRFFADGIPKYINRITDGTPKQPSDIATLISFEYIVIHEWMHNKLFGYRFMIEDLKANIPGRPDQSNVYGDSMCHEYAWLHMDQAMVNLNTAYNADNYAWFFNYNWFYWHWQWNDDGSHSKRSELAARDDGDDSISFDSDEGAIDDSTIDMSQDTVPINVHPFGNSNTDGIFDYVGEDYNDFVADSTQPFVSPNSNCILSAECNLSDGNAINAKCVCTCDGQIASLEDDRCAGFAGSLPDPPSNSSPNGP